MKNILDIQALQDEEILIEELPILPSKTQIIYPHILFPMIINDDALVQLIDDVLIGSKIMGVFLLKDSSNQPTKLEDLHIVGTAVNVIKMFQAPDKSIRLLVQGISRIRLIDLKENEPYMRGHTERIQGFQDPTRKLEIDVLIRSIKDHYNKIIQISSSLPEELKTITTNIKEPDKLADMVISSLNVTIQEKQELLEIMDTEQRLTRVLEILGREIKVTELDSEIQTKVDAELTRTQREYYLREQMKAIRKELGEEDERSIEIKELKKNINDTEMPKHVEKVANKELNRLSNIPLSTPEYAIIRTYLDWLTNLPWKKHTKDTIDINKAQNILDEEHYNLKDVKDRILEFLAVHKLKKSPTGSILCFVGPPGVGKTSLGRAIALAMGRRFIRFSLGGIRDEAEIRGHRRTYIGALPGRIIQGIKQAGTFNPVFMLDEIDKIGQDFRGDPASALLEVLDPEQNTTFSDHYLEVPYDLSRAMFIATANVIYTIPDALRDRMEILHLPGYINQEKVQIAMKHLLPRQIENNGLTAKNIAFKEEAISRIVINYTREAGVRNLERQIANICRKVARLRAEGYKRKITVTIKKIEEFLGPQKFFSEIASIKDEIGMTTGLAWSPTGGEVLFIEVRLMKGNKNLMLTGQLGDVMKESAQAALSYIRSEAKNLGIDESKFNEIDIHVHVPAGATPKDGPSAGVAIATSLVSALANVPVDHTIAMTGEITLRGQVSPIGGVREKVVAANRAGIKTVILPKLNERDLNKVPENIRQSLKFVFVDKIDEVLDIALRNGKPNKTKN